jgi:transposase
MQAKGEILANSFRKLDPLKVRKLKAQGLTNSQIAQRLGVTQGAIYHVLRKRDTGETDSSAHQQDPARLAPDLL